MAQFAVFVVPAVPAVGGVVHATVYRGDNTDAAAVIADAAAVLALKDNMKVWACPVSALTPYRVDVSTTRAVVLE